MNSSFFDDVNDLLGRAFLPLLARGVCMASLKRWVRLGLKVVKTSSPIKEGRVAHFLLHCAVVSFISSSQHPTSFSLPDVVQ